MVAVFSVPNVNNGWNKAIGNWNCFHENVHHMRRNSSSYKISVCSKLKLFFMKMFIAWAEILLHIKSSCGPGSSTVVSLAVLSCLTFFSVSCNADYIMKMFITWEEILPLIKSPFVPNWNFFSWKCSSHEQKFFFT